MSDIKLFRLTEDIATEMHGVASDFEKPLQTLIEKNLESLLGVRFLATEYSTGKTHRGRIDTLGLDENNTPVIFEYKRSSSENVINQGLFYLDWLMDHKAEYEQLVNKILGKAGAEAVDWSSPRVICIANDFTRYDEHAVQQIGRNIELFRYRQFGKDLFLLELVNVVEGKTLASKAKTASKTSAKTSWTYGADALPRASHATRDLFTSLEGYVMSLSDDVQRKDLKYYIAFKRIKNFVTVEIYKERLLLHLPINPDNVQLVKGFTRDVRGVGHWGTGDLEVIVRTEKDLADAKFLIKFAHDGGLKF